MTKNKYSISGIITGIISLIGSLFCLIAIGLYFGDVCDLFPAPICVWGMSFLFGLGGLLVTVIGKNRDDDELKISFIITISAVITAMVSLAVLILTLLISAL